MAQGAAALLVYSTITLRDGRNRTAIMFPVHKAVNAGLHTGARHALLWASNCTIWSLSLQVSAVRFLMAEVRDRTVSSSPSSDHNLSYITYKITQL